MTCATDNMDKYNAFIGPQGGNQSSMNWNIPEFDTLCTADAKQFQRIYSPLFSVEDDVNLKSRWCLGVEGADGLLSCSLYFHGTSGPDDDIQDMTAFNDNEKIISRGYCTFKIGIGNSKNPFYIIKNCEDVTELRSNDGFGFEFVSIKKLFEQQDMFLEDNTLRLCLLLVVYGTPLSSRSHGTEPVVDNFECSANTNSQTCAESPSDCQTVSIKSDKSMLCEDILSCNNYSDIKIRCRSQVFYCHKLILSGRIPVILEDEFDRSPLDANNEIIIEDIEPPVLGMILQFIYTGTFDLPKFPYWSAVLFAAEKYELKDLKEQCYDKMFHD